MQDMIEWSFSSLVWMRKGGLLFPTD
jgi:hypothetical protein